MINIKSMTGYGKGVHSVAGKKITVEIRSLNNKGIDITVKMPSAYKAHEMDIRSKVTSSLLRGKIEVSISCELEASAATVPINRTTFKNYYNELVSIGEELGINVSSADLCRTILHLPEVMQVERTEVNENEWEALESALEEAIKSINAFREQEGSSLIKDILFRISLIEKYKQDIIPFEQGRIEIIKGRIRESIEAMSLTIDNNRFEQELIYYIEKLDITEEKVRLQNHLDYFREVCSTEEAPGKKLGFICQEIGREINTTGSKSNNSDMQKIVVQMKDELEKIKEQSLNIM